MFNIYAMFNTNDNKNITTFITSHNLKRVLIKVKCMQNKI